MEQFKGRMSSLAKEFGTPLYVYDADKLTQRFSDLDALFGAHFGVSFAVKSNPNVELLKLMLPHVSTFDVSSYTEVERALDAGCPAKRITFSGPAKRDAEIRGAISLGLGELVVESVAEAKRADYWAKELGVKQPVIVRINPTTGPRHFGVSFSGRASQFGIDQEVLDEALDTISCLKNIKLIGFHIYSGTNSLNPGAIAENFSIFIDLFRRGASRANIRPEKLIFGSGFGLTYGGADQPLDIEAVAALTLPQIDELKADPRFSKTRCVLEMGRWLIGPAGWLLTSVVGEKTSRGVNMRLCDAGFNTHLAACGMMGTVIRRNWHMENISNRNGKPDTYTLVGPLCTTIDVLATDISLPEVKVGDVIAIENSGAYGLTASPTRFISHPEPAEIIVHGEEVIIATESDANHWRLITKDGRLKTDLLDMAARRS
jgi:diaminopimelate decarboxylase